MKYTLTSRLFFFCDRKIKRLVLDQPRVGALLSPSLPLRTIAFTLLRQYGFQVLRASVMVFSIAWVFEWTGVVEV